MVNIRVNELNETIKRTQIFPSNLSSVDYQNLLAHKLIVTKETYDNLDKTVCFSCRA